MASLISSAVNLFIDKFTPYNRNQAVARLLSPANLLISSCVISRKDFNADTIYAAGNFTLSKSRSQIEHAPEAGAYFRYF